jgi:hypothetical protein
VRLGRLAFAPGEVPDEGVTVTSHYGFSADMGGGPYDRRRELADVTQFDWIRTVSQNGPADFANLSAALAAWANPAGGNRADAIITITDNGTYRQPISLDFPDNGRLVVQAANGRRPTLLFREADGTPAALTVTGGDSPNAALFLNGLLMEGDLRVAAESLGLLRMRHCTLVPGRRLDEEGRPREPEQPSLTVEAPNTRLEIEIDFSILGPMRLPVDMERLTVRDSILDSPARTGSAQLHPVLLSGSLQPFPALTSAAPAIQVTIGTEGPFTTLFPGMPATLAQARQQLEAAIRTAHDTRAFTGARVVIVAQRLAVLPGRPARVTIDPAGADPTAAELRLDRASARPVHALIGGPLPPSLTLQSSTPTVRVSMGAAGGGEAVLAAATLTRDQARAQLQTAIRNAQTTDAFQDALVGLVDDRLLVLPGSPEAAVVISAAPSDPTTMLELALESARPAIAASEAGELPGPPTVLERTTLFGPVHVRELPLASVVIFNQPVTAERRQGGCVRFSSVPEESATPRRYRCQPDLALQERAEALGVDSAADLPPVEATLIRARLRPSFTSVHYGDPGYAQLGHTTAGEIRTGAEDGSEMGAFQHLHQPHREANLRIRLEEYLPFGLEPGFIYVT